MIEEVDDLLIREALVDDLAALRLLEQAVVEAERPFNSDIKNEGAIYYDLKDLISSDQSLLLCAQVNDEIIASGYIQIRESKGSLQHDFHGYLGFMYVAPGFRGRGINKLLTQQLLAWGKEQNIESYYLDVYSANAAAIRAYEKMGFQGSMLEMKLKL